MKTEFGSPQDLTRTPTPHAIRHFTREDIVIPPMHEVFDALMQLKAAGKIRYIGVSNFGAEKLTQALKTGAEIIVNELPYSLLTRAIELHILPKCNALGIGVLGYMSLLQGGPGRYLSYSG